MSATHKKSLKFSKIEPRPKITLNFTEYQLQKVRYVRPKTIQSLIEFLNKRGYQLTVDPYNMSIEELDKAINEIS